MKLKHLLLLLMTVVSFSTTRAADDTTVVPTNWTKVAFNSDFRYSQWVINSRLGDFYGNSTQVGFTQYDGNGNIVGSAKTSKFDYVPGLVAKATLEARDLYKDFDWSKPWFYTVLNYGKAYTYTAKSASEQNSKGLKGLTLDNMNAAKMYFGIAADALATSSDKTFSEEQIAGIITDMKLYNENWAIGGANSTNELGDAVAGGWFHKPEYVDQMWGDGLYMGSALLAQIINNKGASANVTDNDWDLITKQFRISWKYMYNETNGLLWHAFTANRTTAMNAGWEGVTADGSTYHSAAHWGRACGWYFLALVDVLEQMQIQIKAEKLQKTDANYNELTNYVKLLAAGLAEYQDASGCWYQIIDEKDSSLAGNYLESSCTAIFTAAYLKGARLDLFGDKKNDYIAVAEKAYEGFVNNFMMRDANGDAQLIHCCASAGLGGSKKRSGSRDYYITGDDVTQRNTYTEGKVLGGFILAATEYERLHANEKPVLLTLDLHPECKLDGKTALEVAVNGSGNETYQWYEKTNGEIPGAKSATYTPTNDGIYYCAITVPATSSSAKGRIAARAAEYTLTSSETNVTVTAETEGAAVVWNFENATVGSLTSGTTYTYKDVNNVYDLNYVAGSSCKIAASDITISGENYTKYLYMGGNASTSARYFTFKAPTAKGKIKMVFAGTVNGTVTFKDNTTSTTLGTLTPVANTVVTSGILSTTVNTEIKIECQKCYIYSIAWIPETELTKYAVTTSATNGSIDVVDGSGNTVTTPASVAEGTKLVFTATANPGYKFDAWNVVGTQGTASGTTYTISSLDQATTVTASFVKDSSTGNDGDICDFNGGGSSQTWAKLITGKVQELTSAVRYKDEDYSRGVKFESSTEIEITLSEPKTVNFVFAKTSKSTAAIKINEGSGMTLEDKGDYYLVTVSLEAGKYSVKKAGSGESYLAAIELITLSASDLHILGTVEGESKTNYVNNSNTWTPAAGGTIALSDLVKSSSTGAYTITSGNDVATLDGTTLTAKKTGGTVTLTQAADGEYASGSVDINIAIGNNVAKDGTNAYTVEKDKVYSDGLTVTREDITMTLGNDGFWSKGTAYTAGQNTPKPNSGNIPTSGTYYKFRPTKSGTLAVNVYIGKTDDGKLRPLYVSENGTAIEAKAGSYTVGKGETPAATEAYQGDVTFAVKENTDYYVYVNGSKMRLYGFEFKSANSNATFTYDKSALTFTKVGGANNTYEATLEVGADKKGQDLSITLSAAAGATVKLGETAVSGNTVTVQAPETVATPATYTVTVTSADGTSTTIYKITVKLKKTAITLKYEPAEWNWDKLTVKEQPGNLPTLTATDASGKDIKGEITITYESDMPSVATVDKDNGTITPVGNSLGRAYIYATFKGNDEYEGAEVRCSIFIRDGYTYNVTSEGAEYKPGINTFKYITTTNDTSGKTGTQLLRMKFGGWKWNGGEYVKPSICKGTDWQSKDADGKNYVTDSWETAISSGVDPIDGFTAGFSGKNDACNESMSAEKYYKKTRYGWFKAPSGNDNNLHDPNNITVTYPFTLPVRGAYMTFEPMVNGTLSVFVVQNGAWNTWDKNSSNPHTYVHELDDVVQKEYTIDHTFNKGDIKLGEFRPHSFQVVNQRGLTLSQFATEWSVDTKQDVTATNPVTGNKLYCKPKEKGQDPFSDNVALWPEFKDGRLTDGEQKDIAEAWAGGPRGHQKIVMLHDGSFLAVQKCIVKYTFHVTGQETYYFFSNFSKMGFCGANFTPDPDTAQPTATLELNDQVAYPTVKATETGEYYDGNSQMPTFGGKELPKIKKHTFTVTKADGTKIDGVNVEGVQAPQFKTITVQRDFKQGQWTTLTLPFNMTQKKVEEVFGVGTELLLLKSSEMNGSAVRLHFIYHEIQNVLPGYPYLIKPTLKDADGNNYSNGTTDASTIVETDGALVLTSFNVPVKHITQAAKQLTFGESGPYILKGVEKYCTPEATDKFPFSVNLKEGDVFLSDSNGKFYVSKGESYCKGYRAYMTTADPQVTPAKSVILTYSGVEDNPDNGTATEISIAELSPDAVMTLGLKGVYNLSGQKVANTADNLPAGIYVVNGQKIVVK